MEPIAIIGIGCRFPNSENPESFWRLLRNGVDAITEVPKQRWDIDAFYDPQPGIPGKMSTRWGGFLEQVDEFDPSFFGISPREVERMDPQQRLALEVAWEALENAGIAPDKLSGSQTGVFMGIGNYDYCRLLTKDLSLVSAYDGTGNTLSITANRLSYILNLRGPSAIIETACSSSLVALHFACRSLQQQESNLFVVGGVSLMLSPEPFITYSHARMMASDGRCKTFDASADGYVRGEGCGVVVLKRLSDAQKDGDNILAVIKGSAVNQDGLSNGLTAPNGPSQQAVIRQALKNAGLTPDQISYVEAHGTGTSLGDPIEFKSLKAVLMQRQPDQPCWLGSVKTNIGHLEAASGIASVIKVVLALQHKEIPPHLHLKQLNPYISLEGTTFNIPTQPQLWESGTQSRLAGISAFGFGGTNCHVILSEAPTESQKLEVKNQDNERPFHILTLSAKTEESLLKLAQRYADFLTTHPDVSLASVCFTANTGRTHFEQRLAVVAESNIQLRERLLAFAAGNETTGLVSGQVNGKKRSKIAFLFTGQGSQYIDMGRQLYETQSVFRQAIDDCNKILHPYLGTSLIKLLYPDTKPQQPKLDKTAYTQPALFALEYALCQLWKSWGIEPTAVMGHSVGEYAAACVAGVFSLEDGLKLIAERARLMQALPKDGEMVAVFASSDQVQAAIQPYEQVSIAAINGPQSIVISGASDSIEAIINSLQALGIKTKKLNVSHAFHSPLMAPMLADFERIASGIKYSAPSIKLISNVTGELAKEEIATPQYWCRHIRQPVQFARSMETLHQQGYEMFVEIGPKPILLGMARYCLPDSKDEKSRVWLPSLYPTQQDWQQILQTLAELYVRGVSVDWSSFDSDYRRHRLQLPTYPFVRQRYWVDIPTQEDTKVTNLSHETLQKLFQQLEKTEELSSSELKLLPKLLELLVKQQQVGAVPIKDWLYDTEWQLKPRQLTIQEKNKVEKGSWLIFADLEGVGQSLAKLLRELSHDCILVYPGYSFRQKEAGTWVINPSEKKDFERLFQELGIKQPLQFVIHLWGLETGPASELTISTLEQTQTLGVGSVLHLLQTLVKHNNTPRLWLATRGAVPVASQLMNPAQAPLWGLGKVIALEHPQLWGGMLDLAPSSKDDATKLLAEILDSQGEDHLAFRDDNRYVARLVKKQLPSQEVKLRSDGTYLITGGLGALGRHVARFLVEKGARHLVLVGRRRASDEALETLKDLEQLGAKVLVVQADVSNEADFVSVFEQIKTSKPPLRGIIHTAGILDDGILLQQDWERFAGVMAPKLTGAWNLHKLTQELPLDFFVLFSSAASLLGSPGQGNYAAANAFMDALAHYRVSIGQPGLSINWGPWSDAGMAANLNSRQQARMAAQGMNTIATNEGLLFLEQLLGQASAQVGVLPFELSVFSQQLKLGKIPLFEKLLGETSLEVEPEIVQKYEILEKLQEASASEREKLLIAYLKDKGAKVLGLSNSDLDIDQSLQDLGFDSLMAVDLTGIIRTELQVELPIRAFVEEPTINTLATLLIEQLIPGIAASEVITNVLDLGAETVLDPAITPDNIDIEPTIEPTTEPNSIFLTGATGFLGAYLLQELLDQTQADIYCLVRSPNIESAKIRLQNNLQDYELWNENYSSRIIPVLGDLSQPLLGLENEEFESMASLIDTIYHNGAFLNYVYPYSKFKPINVLGTQEVLRLACKTKVKPVHHISSVAVFESSAYYGKTITETDPVDCSEGIYLGYSQSKWVSEKLVQIAGQRGLPITIYRPPLVSGNSQTGLWNTDGFLCRMIKGCIQMGSIMTNLDLMLDLSPVDYNSRAIVYLSRQKQSLGKAFHLQNPNLLHWRQLVDFICSMGYPMERVSYEEWLLRLSNSRENPLYPLLPFFSHKWSSEQLTYIELNQQDKRPQISCEETLAALNGTSIVCPPLDARLLDTYFRYFIRSGFLEAPKAILVV
ncbi:beta-ketoacyl synthase [Calothrix sp. PCC 7716]|nr:beta-ketoacyl synthase [Calothrix sp. PCC 7716]